MIHVGWKHTGEKKKIWPKRKKKFSYKTVFGVALKKVKIFFYLFRLYPHFPDVFHVCKLLKIAAQHEPWVFTRYFTPYLASIHPRSESYFGSHRGWILIFVTIQILELLLIGESKFLTNQRCYPDPGSDTSSVWNLCARFSDVTWWGNQWWRREMWVVCSQAKLGHLRVEMPHCTWCAYQGTKALRTRDRN